MSPAQSMGRALPRGRDGPTAAIKPKRVSLADGKEVKSVEVNEPRCMFCGNCYTMCMALPLTDKEGDCVTIMAGGKVSNRISPPKFSKVVVAGVPVDVPGTTNMITVKVVE